MRRQHPFEAITTSVDGDCLAVLPRAEQEFTVSRLFPLLGPQALPRQSRRASIRQVGNVNSHPVSAARLTPL